MEIAQMQLWHSARYNIHLQRALADRYGRLELRAAMAVCALGPPALISLLVSSGSMVYAAAGCGAAGTLAAVLLMRWGRLHSAHADALIAWQNVERLCEDGRGGMAMVAAAAAQRCLPPSGPTGHVLLQEAARAATSADPR